MYVSKPIALTSQPANLHQPASQPTPAYTSQPTPPASPHHQPTSLPAYPHHLPPSPRGGGVVSYRTRWPKIGVLVPDPAGRAHFWASQRSDSSSGPLQKGDPRRIAVILPKSPKPVRGRPQKGSPGVPSWAPQRPDSSAGPLQKGEAQDAKLGTSTATF